MFKGLQKLINSNSGKYIISIILGIGLATLFRKSCQNRNCLIFKAAPNEKIKDKIFKSDGQCYTYDEENIKCGTLKQQIEFN